MDSGEQELKRRLAIDLKGSFDLLVVAYQQKLYALVWYMIRNSEDAKDIVQDAFINAYKALSKMPPKAIKEMKLRPWLLKIAYNLSLNHISRTSQSASIDLVDESKHFQHISPEADFEGKETKDELYICIMQLPDTLRIPVILHYILGISYKEIADDILHQPFNTVKSHGRRGLEELRKALEAQKHPNRVKEVN